MITITNTSDKEKTVLMIIGTSSSCIGKMALAEEIRSKNPNLEIITAEDAGLDLNDIKSQHALDYRRMVPPPLFALEAMEPISDNFIRYPSKRAERRKDERSSKKKWR